MWNMTGLSFEDGQDLREISLYAALCPEFRDRLLEALFGINAERPPVSDHASASAVPVPFADPDC